MPADIQLLIRQTLADGTHVRLVVDADTEPFIELTSQSNQITVVQLSQRDIAQLATNLLSLLQTSLLLLKGLESDAPSPIPHSGSVRSRGDYASHWNPGGPISMDLYP